MRLEFTKMEGLGNDYIYIDAARFHIEDPSSLAVRLSDRHFGIGSDGLVLIGRSDKADFSMRMFNADGSEGQMCGNAARCIGKYVYERGLTSKTTLKLETPAGVKTLYLHLDPDGLVGSVSVDMGHARVLQRDLAVEACGQSFRGSVVDVGNPHFVILCDDAEAVDLERIGPAIEHNPLFPDRINVEFVSVVMPGSLSSHVMPDTIGHLRMRVWERGSGITLACGTGASASAAAMVTAGIVSSPCKILMDGGTLTLHYNADGTLLMEGPARIVFEGVVKYQ